VVVEAFGPAEAAIAHSLGATAAARALREGLRIGRLVFIAPAADPADWTPSFAERLGIAPAVMSAMQTRSERRLGVLWSDLNLARPGSTIAVPLLVVHDREDDEVPCSDRAAIAAASPSARPLITRGLGTTEFCATSRSWSS
jgi:pimeloyl-ACP methyl ester carboxylesterase